MKHVLFVCTGNAGRSQIAEALFARVAGSDTVACSAGVAPWDRLHPVAVRLLQERGIDTTGRQPKHVNRFTEAPLDWVVLIGDRAQAEAPPFRTHPGLVHWDIADPADADGTGQEEATFRQTLAMIEERLPGVRDMVERGTRPADLHLEPGLSTCAVRPNKFDPSVHLPMMAAAGFRCIELNCFLGSDDFPWDRPAGVKELQRVAEEAGVRVASVHAEGGLGSYGGARSERLAVDLCKAYADLAAELGAAVVVVHAGLRPEASRPQAVAQLRASLDELAHHVRGMPCAYAWENKALGLSVDEHLQWIRDLGPSAFGFVLDTGHSNIDGQTDAYLDACRGLLCSLHLNDNDAKRDQHRVPGAGTASWQGFVARLARSAYVGPLMLEFEARERQGDLGAVLAEARASVDFLKRQ